MSGNSFQHSFIERLQGAFGVKQVFLFFSLLFLNVLLSVFKYIYKCRESKLGRVRAARGKSGHIEFVPAWQCMYVCVCVEGTGQCERQQRRGSTCLMYCDNSVRYVAFMGTPCPGDMGE